LFGETPLFWNFYKVYSFGKGNTPVISLSKKWKNETGTELLSVGLFIR
jgi:hypothetical protein